MATTATPVVSVSDVYKTIELIAPDVKNSYRPLKSLLPRMDLDRTALELLVVSHGGAIVDISTATGEPVEIPSSTTSKTTNVVRFAAKTAKAQDIEYKKEGVVKVKFSELYRQFIMNEEKYICDSLTANVDIPTTSVDTVIDTQAPTPKMLYDAIMGSIFKAKAYGVKDVVLLISNDVSDLLTAGTAEYNSIIKELDAMNVDIITSDYLTETAYVIPKSDTVCGWVKLMEDEIKFVVDLENNGYMFGRENVAFVVLQPNQITRLNIATV